MGQLCGLRLGQNGLSDPQRQQQIVTHTRVILFITSNIFFRYFVNPQAYDVDAHFVLALCSTKTIECFATLNAILSQDRNHVKAANLKMKLEKLQEPDILLRFMDHDTLLTYYQELMSQLPDLTFVVRDYNFYRAQVLKAVRSNPTAMDIKHTFLLQV